MALVDNDLRKSDKLEDADWFVSKVQDLLDEIKEHHVQKFLFL